MKKERKGFNYTNGAIFGVCVAPTGTSGARRLSASASKGAFRRKTYNSPLNDGWPGSLFFFETEVSD